MKSFELEIKELIKKVYALEENEQLKGESAFPNTNEF